MGWGSAAVEHYLDRLGVADDLDMDTSPGSSAEAIARREAARLAAGVPCLVPGSRGGDMVDAAIDAFGNLGGLRFLGILGEEGGQP